jgi:hypothetical protein
MILLSPLYQTQADYFYVGGSLIISTIMYDLGAGMREQTFWKLELE